MTILITGGTGLVGSRLLPRLVEAGWDCRALIRTGNDAPAGVTRVEGDILDRDSLASAMEGVSAVVHLAAVLRTPDPDEIRRVNVEGTRNLLDAARTHAPDARFIMASTGLVYKHGIGRPARESDPAEADRPYPASKLQAETELRESGLNWSILRLAFVYGEEDGHLQSAPGLLGDWNWHPALRMTLIHHRDIATAVELALAGAFDGHIANIGDESPTSIYEIAQIVGAPYEPSSEPLTNPWMGQMDITLARSRGFQPKIPTVYQAARERVL